MKEKYETPICEVILFEAEDVITMSGIGDGGGEDRPFNSYLREKFM